MPDFKVFWKWTLDRYKRVDAASNLNNYWRVLEMYLLDKADRDFDQQERRDLRNIGCRSLYIGKSYADVPAVCSVSTCLSSSIASAHSLKKPVIGLDDLYLLLYIH